MPWHWFITIPIGDCESDELVLKRLRRIENELCKRYLINRYWRLPANARFTMAIAFEGERELGTRHAHILAYIPQSIRTRISQEMAIGLFPSEFCSRWEVQNTSTNSGDSNLTYVACGKNKRNAPHHIEGIRFGEVNKARVVYTAKDVAPSDLPWSRFEFVTASKSKNFSNRNSSVILNRNRQRRRYLDGLDASLPDRTRSQIAS
jgi:hypothetical protein